MKRELRRISTRYVSVEDRILIHGELPSGDTVSLWLTQRILVKTLPHLIDWLEKQIPADLKNAGHSDQAREMLQVIKQPPVEPRSSGQQPPPAGNDSEPPENPEDMPAPSAPSLVTNMELAAGDKGVRLKFHGTGMEAVGLILDVKQLRQWLAVINMMWRRADWPPAIWPNWMNADIELVANRSSGVFH